MTAPVVDALPRDVAQTVARAVLCTSIERGVQALDQPVTDAALAPLRRVGEEAAMIAVGTYFERGVGCPVAQAYPGQWWRLTWDTPFTLAFDAAMRDAGCYSGVARVTP